MAEMFGLKKPLPQTSRARPRKKPVRATRRNCPGPSEPRPAPPPAGRPRVIGEDPAEKGHHVNQRHRRQDGVGVAVAIVEEALGHVKEEHARIP